MTGIDVIGPSTGEGDCECVMLPDGGTSVIGSCACPIHGMKALRAEVERLRGEIASMREAAGTSRRWTISWPHPSQIETIGTVGHAGRCDPASESEVEVADATDHEVARCQHCPALADERSFMCEDCAGEADAERDDLVERLDEAIKALERIVSYAYGASGATGDDAGHLTHVGMTAKYALAGVKIGEGMSEVGETLRHKTVIGRERALIGALAKALNMTVGGPPPSRATAAELRRHRSSKTWETHLGTAFEVQIIGPDGRITGHIARVTVELDRFEAGTTGEKP